MDLTRRGALAVLAVLALSVTACDPQRVARLEEGVSTEVEVRTLLGRPAQVKRYALKNEEVWDWRFKQNGQESGMFRVTFGADDRVLGTAIGDDAREITSDDS